MSAGMGSMTPGPGWPAAPMTVGRLLGRTWVILRGHMRLWVKLSVMPTAAMIVAYGALFGCLAAMGLIHFPPPQQPPDPRLLWMAIPLALVVVVPMMVVFAVYQAATCEAAIAVNRGVTPNCGDLYREAWSKAGRYTWLVVLCWLIVMVPLMAGFFLFGLAGLLAGHSGSDGNPGAFLVLLPLIFLLYLGAAVYMVWMTLRLGLAMPACVTEDISAWEAVQRSGRLTTKAKGRMFVVLLVLWAISYAVMLVFELVSMAVIGILLLIGSALHMEIQQPASIAALVVLGIVFMAAILLFSMVMWAAYGIALSVIYEDQLLRIDGPPASPALAGGGLA